MIWVGLTGGIGSGKTTVANIMKSMGIPVANADQFVHELLSGQTQTYSQVLNHFGNSVLDSKGEINRAALGDIVFKDPNELKWLEGLLHPLVREKTEQWKQQQAHLNSPLAVYDIPLLFEKSLQNTFDKIVVVTTSEDIQVQRVMHRSGLSKQQVLERIQNQIPLEEKVKQADFVIENLGSEESLRDQVRSVLVEISKL